MCVDCLVVLCCVLFRVYYLSLCIDLLFSVLVMLVCVVLLVSLVSVYSEFVYWYFFVSFRVILHSMSCVGDVSPVFIG